MVPITSMHTSITVTTDNRISHPWEGLAVTSLLKARKATDDKMLIVSGDGGYDDTPESEHINISIKSLYNDLELSLSSSMLRQLNEVLAYFLDVHDRHILRLRQAEKDNTLVGVTA